MREFNGGAFDMKKYERPEVELMKLRAEDIITLSYMLPEMPIDTDTNNDTRAK